jgi:hypothetical protein
MPAHPERQRELSERRPTDIVRTASPDSAGDGFCTQKYVRFGAAVTIVSMSWSLIGHSLTVRLRREFNGELTACRFVISGQLQIVIAESRLQPRLNIDSAAPVQADE